MTKPFDTRSLNEPREVKDKPKFDLEERTAKFGEEIIQYCKQFPRNLITEPLIRQLLKSGTSIGANYCEADDACSRKEFRQKIGYCKKESRETKFWLRMLAVAEPAQAERARILWQESHELHLIFATIHRKLSQKPKDE